ncbi:MAG: hypothetical protein KF843_00785 [Flavobacteriales bacterium]|nr:hypothetical protein [Flavobacteriales bacterium]
MTRISSFGLFLLLALSVNAQLNNGLIAYYPFNNGNTNNQSGTSFSTLYAQGTSGTTNALGMANQALAFGGSDPQLWLDTDDLIDFGLTTSFTFITDFRSSSSAQQNLFRDLLSTGVGWRIGFYGNTGYVSFQSGAGASLVDIHTAVTYNDGAWHQVALLVDKSSMTVRMNVDNVPQELAGTVCGEAISGTMADISLCNFNANENNTQLTTFGEDLVGAMDEIRLYGRLLAPGELNTAYALSFGGPTAIAEPTDPQVVDRYDPQSSVLYLSTPMSMEHTMLSITSLDGKVLETRTLPSADNKVELARYGAGIYFVSLGRGATRWTGRYVVAH